MNVSKNDNKLLFGGSVHPYRDPTEMLGEIERCIAEGAVLFTWAPSVQRIDIADDRCMPFYVALARERMPLLVHAGACQGPALIDFRTRHYDDPLTLTRPLDAGVPVIVTHGTSPAYAAAPIDRDYFNCLIGMLSVADQRGWNLYADISSFILPTKQQHYIDSVIDKISLGLISSRRFLYGSGGPGWPVCAAGPTRGPETRTANMLDKRHSMLRSMGIEDSIFTNARDVLRLPR
jgi:predicted TIM-barrel fold metal-dependent hydrolase